MAGAPPLAGVVYIAGVPRSGTTLLTILLGSHPQIAAGGELSAFSRRARAWHGDPLEKSCSCGAENVPSCPFWKAVDDDLGRQGLSLTALDVESQDPATFASHNRALLQSLRQISGKPLVVDASKHLRRLERLSSLDSVAVRPLVLERGICGVAYSHSKRGGGLYERASHAALVYYSLSRRLGDERALWVRYEALASRPRRELSRIARWLELEPEEARLGSATSAVHVVSGSQMRLNWNGTIAADETWRKQLTPWQKLRIFLLSQRRRVGGVRAIATKLVGRDAVSKRSVTSGP